MHLKQFSIGRFAWKRQLPRQGPGSPRCPSSLPAALLSWQICRGDGTTAHPSLGKNWQILNFLAHFSASSLLSHIHPHPQSHPFPVPRRNPRQESVSKHADPMHTLSISPSSYLLGDLLFFIYSQAGFITVNAWGESSGRIKRPNSSTLHCSVLVWSSSKVKRHEGGERGKGEKDLTLLKIYTYIYIYVEIVESSNNFIGFIQNSQCRKRQ